MLPLTALFLCNLSVGFQAGLCLDDTIVQSKSKRVVTEWLKLL